MLNRLHTAVIRELALVRVPSLSSLGRSSVRTMYHPTRHTVFAYNFGSRVRPDVAPIAVQPNGHETVESFLARGGRIVTGAPKIAKGAVLVTTVKSRTTKIATSRG